MERWTYERYQSPALTFGEIYTDISRNLVLFDVAGYQTIELKASGISANELADTIRAFQDHNSISWQDVRAGRSASWIYSLLKQLDDLSLIDECKIADSDNDIFIYQVKRIIQSATKYLTEIISKKFQLYEASFQIIQLLLSNNRNRLNSCKNFWIENNETNFAIQSISIQISYASIHFPEMLFIWENIIKLTEASIFKKYNFIPNENISIETINTSDIKDIETYTLSFLHFVILSGLRVGRRLTVYNQLMPDTASSGLAIAVKAERMLSIALESLGASNYFTLLASQNGSKISPLIQGIYIEQFHVTYRFVEIIGPLLAKRFRSKLRRRIFNYFQEEFGHEKFELETCKELGLNPSQVECSIPLPLSTLYIDAYTVLAHESPLSFMLALMITEGFVGQGSFFHDQLRKLIQHSINSREIAFKHHDLNEELNHSSLTRLFLSEINYISPQQQTEMLKVALFILELNFRVLEEISIFYGNQTEIDFCNLEKWVN